jgi:hypothetical protein
MKIKAVALKIQNLIENTASYSQFWMSVFGIWREKRAI